MLLNLSNLLSYVAAVDPNATFSQIMSIVQKGLYAVGAFLIAWGAVQLGTAISDGGGPGVRTAILMIIGGAIVGAAGALVTNITI